MARAAGGLGERLRRLLRPPTAAPVRRRTTTPRPPAAPLQPTQRITLMQHGVAHVIDYHLDFAPNKPTSLRINAQGLRVRVDPHLPIALVEDFIQKKSAWILKHLQQAAQRRNPVPTTQGVDGESIRVLGRTVRLYWRQPPADVSADDWFMPAPARATAQVEPHPRQLKAYRERLHDELLDYARLRLAQLCAAHGMAYQELALSNARTTWGTCSSTGRIHLNWRLVFLPTDIVDYVVAHELAHTRHMNHSRAFWLVVQHLCPDFQAQRAALRLYDLRATP